MSRHELDVMTWAAVARLGLMSRHGQKSGRSRHEDDVAT